MSLRNLNVTLVASNCVCCVYKTDLMHQIVAPQLSGGGQHNYSTKTRQAGHAYEQYMYSWLSMIHADWFLLLFL